MPKNKLLGLLVKDAPISTKDISQEIRRSLTEIPHLTATPGYEVTPRYITVHLDDGPIRTMMERLTETFSKISDINTSNLIQRVEHANRVEIQRLQESIDDLKVLVQSLSDQLKTKELE